MAYHEFQNENGESYGSFEVFYEEETGAPFVPPDEYLPVGYYWRAGFPGCIPDGEPCGPFDTEKEAIRDAQEG